MTEEQAKKICTLYGFDPDKAGMAFVKVAKDYAEPVRAALEANAQELKPCMKDVGSLKKLAAFLKNDRFGADASKRAACLVGLNRLLPNPPWPEIEARFDGMELPDAVTEMLDTGKQWAPSIKAYLNDKPDKRLLVLLVGRVAMGNAGVAKTEIYELIQYCHDKQISFNLLSDSASSDRGQRLRNINRYRLRAPAMNPFAGIAFWGPGDAADKTAATNVRNHMLKHVLDDDQQPGHSALVWAEEPERWWKLLNIELTYGDVKRFLPSISKQAATLFGASPGDDAKLSVGKTRDFLNLARPPNMTVEFENFMCGRYLKAYQEFALNAAKNYSRCMVGCDKAFGNTVGVYMGAVADVFLFGRLDDAGQQLELSSCYVAQDLDDKFKKAEELWQLTK